jgi:hypothetical protein
MQFNSKATSVKRKANTSARGGRKHVLLGKGKVQSLGNGRSGKLAENIMEKQREEKIRKGNKKYDMKHKNMAF